jgi:hypothetical protein
MKAGYLLELSPELRTEQWGIDFLVVDVGERHVTLEADRMVYQGVDGVLALRAADGQTCVETPGRHR